MGRSLLIRVACSKATSLGRPSTSCCRKVARGSSWFLKRRGKTWSRWQAKFRKKWPRSNTASPPRLRLRQRGIAGFGPNGILSKNVAIAGHDLLPADRALLVVAERLMEVAL